jgi:hypothetical protein
MQVTMRPFHYRLDQVRLEQKYKQQLWIIQAAQEDLSRNLQQGIVQSITCVIGNQLAQMCLFVADREIFERRLQQTVPNINSL